MERNDHAFVSYEKLHVQVESADIWPEDVQPFTRVLRAYPTHAFPGSQTVENLGRIDEVEPQIHHFVEGLVRESNSSSLSEFMYPRQDSPQPPLHPCRFSLTIWLIYAYGEIVSSVPILGPGCHL